MSIQPEITTLEQLIKDTQATLTKAQQDLKDYQKSVQDGKLTLGSPLEDFVFVHHIDNREYMRAFYTEFSKLCTTDQPIMFEHTGTTSRLKSSSWGGRHEYQSESYTTLLIGILTGPPTYNTQKGLVIFPVEFYIQNHHRTFSPDKPVRKESPIVQSVASFKNYGKFIFHQYVRGDSSAMPLVLSPQAITSGGRFF